MTAPIALHAESLHAREPSPRHARASLARRFGAPLLLGLSALALDVASKAWASRALLAGPRQLGAHVQLLLAHNEGAAFSSFAHLDASVRRPLLISIAVLALLFVGRLLSLVSPARRALHFGLCLIASGALGNLVDRIRDGRVVDFVRLHGALFGAERSWPVFNVADVAIVIGCGLLAWDAMHPTSAAATSSP